MSGPSPLLFQCVFNNVLLVLIALVLLALVLLVLESSFSISAAAAATVSFPDRFEGFTTSEEIFAFFNPAIEGVTFCLPGWCTIGVYFWLAFAHLGHEYQDLWSTRDEMHECTD